MIATYCTYISILFISVIGTSIAIKTKNCYQKWFLLFLVFFGISVLLGGRYEVGTDWVSYKESFDQIVNYGINFSLLFRSSFEPLYLILNYIISLFTSSSSILFLIISLFSFFILIKATDNNNKKILPLIIYFYICIQLGFSLNVIRQALSILFFFLSIKYYNISKVRQLIFLLFAILFHYSSIILIPTLFIGKRLFSILDNRVFSIIAYLTTLTFSTLFSTILVEYIPVNFLSVKYVNNLENLDIEMSISTGMGILLMKVIDLVIIIFSNKLKLYYGCQSNIHIILRAYIIGVLLQNIFQLSVLLSRVPYALVSLKIILLAHLVRYLINKRNKTIYNLIGISIIILFFLTFIIGIKNNNGGISPFQFKWI